MRIHQPFPAPENETPPTGGGSPPGGTPPATPPPGEEMANPSKREWADFQKAQRETADLLKQVLAAQKTVAPAEPPKKGEPAQASAAGSDAALKAAVDDMRFELDLERAMRAAKMGDDHPVAELLIAAAKATRPPDLKAFVAKYASLGVPAQSAPAAAQAPPAPPPVPPARGSDQGAPVQGATPGSPDGDPMKWPPEKIAATPNAEFRAAVQAYQDRTRGTGAAAGIRAAARAADERRAEAQKNNRR